MSDLTDRSGHILSTDTSTSNPDNNDEFDDPNDHHHMTTVIKTTEPNNTDTTVITDVTPPTNTTTNDESDGNQIASLSSSSLGTSHIISELYIPPTTTALTLPDGRIIDSKNTLQSFDGATRTVVVVDGGDDDVPRNSNVPLQPQPPVFTLPDGRIIDGKNTLQSFATPPPQLAVHQADTKHPDRVGNALLDETDHILTRNRTSNNTNLGGVTNNEEDVAVIHVEATPVRSVVVDAEIAHSQIDLNRHDQHNYNHPAQRSLSFWLLILLAMMLVGVVAGVGGYCGTGQCGSSTNSLNDNTPVSSPIMITNSPVSIIMPTPNTTFTPVVTPPTSPPIRVTTEIPIALNPAISPVRTPGVTNPTTTRPINEQLTMACNFLLLTNLTECQSTTYIDPLDTLGNTIPTEIGLLTQLTTLWLQDNKLIGSIPSTLVQLTQLTFLSLSINQLTGTIPSTLGNLMQLTWLDLTKNQLTGTIPTTLGNLVQLAYLSLSDIQLTGTIPTEIGLLTQLDYLWLDNNTQLTGTIPSTLGNLMQLSYLVLFNNTQLSGTIPSTLCSLLEISIRIDCANIVCTCCVDGDLNSCPTR